MIMRLITALIALVIQTNASFIPSDIKVSGEFSSVTQDYTIYGFDVFLNHNFFENYVLAKSLNFINCKIEFEEDDERDTWKQSFNNFPVERLSFKNCTIKRSEVMEEVEPYGNGVQDRLRNLKEILYEGCIFEDGISGSTFFVSSATLTHLKIINCYVPFFNFFSFYSLQNLQHVEIKNTNILIDPNMFAQNKKLRYLDIPSNDFEALLDSDFPPTLEYLDISSYHSTILCVTLKNLENLRYLNMSRAIHMINRAGDCIPKYLKSLEVFDFSWNHLEYLANNFLAGMSKLREVYLNNNGLRFIEESALEDLTELVILDLRNNDLMSIKESVFNDLLSLRYIYIGNNQIAKTTSDCFRNRYVLDVDYRNESCLDRFDSLKGVMVEV